MTVSRETLGDLCGAAVSRETFDALQLYVIALLAESERQNLISKSSIAQIWERHIADSLQLAALAPDARSWLDIGSGAGLPGIPIAIATGQPVLLVEPRRLRTDFLTRIATELGLTTVEIVTASLANVPPRAIDAVTARAVAPLDRLLAMSAPFAHAGTIFVFPKGRSAAEEVASVRRTWQGHFHIVPSRTDPASGIVVARDVRRRGK